MQIVSTANTANDNDVVTAPQRTRKTMGASIVDHMGRTLAESAELGSPEILAIHLKAATAHLKGVSAKVPCNSRIGRDDLWDLVAGIAARILPFASSLHEFDEECHRIRSFVGQALTHPAFAVSGTSRMGSYTMKYATMTDMMRVTVSDGERTTGFGLLIDEGGTGH